MQNLFLTNKENCAQQDRKRKRRKESSHQKERKKELLKDRKKNLNPETRIIIGLLQPFPKSGDQAQISTYQARREFLKRRKKGMILCFGFFACGMCTQCFGKVCSRKHTL